MNIKELNIIDAERLDRKSGWAKSHGLKESKRGRGGLNFLNKKAPQGHFPAADHVTYWNKDGKPFCIVSQPYHVFASECGEIAQLAEKYGFNVIINSYPSWHFPMQVVTIVWSKK